MPFSTLSFLKKKTDEKPRGDPGIKEYVFRIRMERQINIYWNICT